MLQVIFETIIFNLSGTYRQKEYEGKLNFGTDAWTSPNHKAFVGTTVHFEQNGEPVSFVLDMIEVAKVRVLSLRVLSLVLFRRLTSIHSHTVA
jgi:hypothetical protein